MIKIDEPDARQEYEALLNEVLHEADGTGERARLMRAKVLDAQNAQREWAYLVQRNAEIDGYAAAIKAHLKRTRVVVNIESREVSKPRTIGTQRLTDEGKVVDLQLPFEVLTFDDIRKKRQEYLTQRRAYDDNIAFTDRLLALAEMAPGANTPAEAAQQLGLSLDDYLAQAS